MGVAICALNVFRRSGSESSSSTHMVTPCAYRPRIYSHRAFNLHVPVEQQAFSHFLHPNVSIMIVVVSSEQLLALLRFCTTYHSLHALSHKCQVGPSMSVGDVAAFFAAAYAYCSTQYQQTEKSERI